MKTLAIETSCDDTSLSVVEWTWETFVVEKMLSYSQVKTHQVYGGVVPEIASREHAHQILHVLFHLIFGDQNTVDIQKTEPDNVLRSLNDAKVTSFFESISSISVTTTPWLPGSLSVGRSIAHFLSKYFEKPLIPVNHIHGHLFSLLIERNVSEIEFPMMVLTVSWGHNELYLISNQWQGGEKIGKYTINRIGRTLDDAAGESFDKVSRMLWWPYPGGPWISKKAITWKSREDIQFTRIFLKASEFNFSFSGMKSQVYRLLDSFTKEWKTLTEQDVSDIAKEFEDSVVEVLAKKLVKSGIQYDVKTIAIAGWVSANQKLRDYTAEYLQSRQGMKIKDEKWELKEIIGPCFLWAPTQRKYCTDNAAMIWVVGLLNSMM